MTTDEASPALGTAGSGKKGSGGGRSSTRAVLDVELVERKNALRRFLVMGTIAWTAFVVTDFIAARVYDTSLEYLVAVRLCGTGLGLTLYLLSASDATPIWVARLIEPVLVPLTAMLVSLAAVRCGGATSPLSLGVGIVVLVRTVLPSPWTRVLPSAIAGAAAFPATMLVASTARPEIAAQLRDPVMMWTFVQTTIFLVLGAGVSAAGSHMLWSAKEQIQQARKLGRYRLVARIGSGGMGEVWLARQMPLNRRVALKILKETTLRDPGALRRFKREAEAASSLVHPNTIRVFDFGASDDGVLFIAMELLDGMDLEAVVDNVGPLVAEVDASDAGIDAQAVCLAACTDGTCDGGWCIRQCAAAAGCPGRIVCPPGVPCVVDCSGAGACGGGIDCTAATACVLTCSGAASCAGPIACSGARCDVRCTSADACNGGRVHCDAGSCDVACSGTASCRRGVTCASSDCAVDCTGPPPAAGDPTCNDGGACTAASTCSVRCTTARACQGGGVNATASVRCRAADTCGRVIATASQDARVQCEAARACTGGIFASSADSRVTCEGMSACGGTLAGVHCDGGSCRASCEDTVGDVRLCCQANACADDTDDCRFQKSCN